MGAELCSSIADRGASRVVLVDQAEAPLVERANTLRSGALGTDVVPVLADIRHPARVAQILDEHRPHVVFHAAAYKQVPLLEAFPVEGVATNVLGTKNVVDAARRAGVERFVLFSSDKAVRPTNVLGRTKALAECIVAAVGREEGRPGYVSVRLGNVADSAGSILPVFRRQIARGGPVTVTHPHMTRYLMTAGEAAALAIVAGGIAEANEAFVLDVGRPVRILDIANRLARAASLDVAIDFVGLRAGERLHEELFWDDDDVAETSCVGVLASPLPVVHPARLADWIDELSHDVATSSPARARAALSQIDWGRSSREVVGEAVAAG